MLIQSAHLSSFRKESDFREVQNFTVSAVGRLEISPGAFSNFPKAGAAIFSEVGLKRVTEKGLEILADLLVVKASEQRKLIKLYKKSNEMVIN